MVFGDDILRKNPWDSVGASEFVPSTSRGAKMSPVRGLIHRQETHVVQRAGVKASGF